MTTKKLHNNVLADASFELCYKTHWGSFSRRYATVEKHIVQFHHPIVAPRIITPYLVLTLNLIPQVVRLEVYFLQNQA